MIDRPNIIYLFPDQLGARHLGCRGNEYMRTRNVDRFAEHRRSNAGASPAVRTPGDARTAAVGGPPGYAFMEYRDQAIVDGRHTLIVNKDGNRELYDLEADPYETWNIYERPDSAGTVEELSRGICDWRQRI